jgi:hypothetical protein
VTFGAESVSDHHVNLFHNPFGPLHGSGNHLVGSRTSLWPAEQIVCPVEIAGHDYPGNDPDDPLAPFVGSHSEHHTPFAFSSLWICAALLSASQGQAENDRSVLEDETFSLQKNDTGLTLAGLSSAKPP